MPTYEYECGKCGHHFDLSQSMKDPPKKTCPRCKGRVRRLISGGAGLIFKGSGFYITDYRSEGYKSAAKKESSSSASSTSAKSSSTKTSSGETGSKK
ncbi:MAG: FmdB family transcriptional regulator [Verrucomicrobia bacterium GWF2_62_7]|nr:MAG: FmdB family transcriptional regulator [Verrucomicrobia bacterium GWF2_62_7]